MMARKRYSDALWMKVREDREINGTSFHKLAEKYNINVATIYEKSKAEGWGDGVDTNAVINQKARELLNGIPNSVGLKKRASAISEAAVAKSGIIKRQQADWENHRISYGPELMENVVIINPETNQPDEEQTTKATGHQFHRLKCAKISAEMLTIRHAGERKSYGITEDEAPQPKAQTLAEFYQNLAKANKGNSEE